MRVSLLITSVVVLAAGSAHAKDVEWAGEWAKEGGGSVQVKGEEGRFSLSASVPASGKERLVAFTGPGRGEQLALEGKLSETRGVAGALGGDRAEGSGKPCTLLARGRTDGDLVIADVTYSVEGAAVRTETWKRKAPLIEIKELRVDGEKLSGPFDGKLAKTGLEVVYVYRGEKARLLDATVFVDRDREEHPGFYKRERLVVKSLGLVAPGEHSFKWSGRDDSDANRLLLEGGYEMRIHADEEHVAREKFSVARPRFVFMGWKWGTDDGLPEVKELEAALSAPASANGYATTTYLAPKDRADVLARMERAAFLVLSSHGAGGRFLVYDGDPTKPKDPEKSTPISGLELKGLDLRDVHVAIVSACEGAKPDGSAPGLVQSLADAGCDLTIGFLAQVYVREAKHLQLRTLQLMERGGTVEKAVRDAAREAFRLVYKNGDDLTEEKIDAEIARQRAGNDTIKSAAAALYVGRPRNNRSEDETFWPPRYGNSRN